MNTKPTLETAPVRPEDVLPDHVDRTEIGGINLRKGTVAAFVRNAVRWSDIATIDADRDALMREMTAAVPALEALGLFTVFTLRDDRLRRSLSQHFTSRQPM